MTTTSLSARRLSSASAICGHTRALRPRQGKAESSSLTRPSSTTWLRMSASGLSSSGFMRTSGAQPAARACRYCAVPISPQAPPGAQTTRALLLMFCALKGATL